MAKEPTGERLVRQAHEFFRRHWRRALLIRDRLRLSEEMFHLLLAALLGVIGASTSLLYHGFGEITTRFLLGRSGEMSDIARMFATWQRIVIPALGGLGAGLVLFLGLRLIGNPGLSNLLEVIVAGDGRLR